MQAASKKRSNDEIPAGGSTEANKIPRLVTESGWHNIRDEIWLEIFSFLSISDLISRVEVANKSWNNILNGQNIINDQGFWCKAYCSNFGIKHQELVENRKKMGEQIEQERERNAAAKKAKEAAAAAAAEAKKQEQEQQQAVTATFTTARRRPNKGKKPSNNYDDEQDDEQFTAPLATNWRTLCVQRYKLHLDNRSTIPDAANRILRAAKRDDAKLLSVLKRFSIRRDYFQKSQKAFKGLGRSYARLLDSLYLIGVYYMNGTDGWAYNVHFDVRFVIYLPLTGIPLFMRTTFDCTGTRGDEESQFEFYASYKDADSIVTAVPDQDWCMRSEHNEDAENGFFGAFDISTISRRGRSKLSAGGKRQYASLLRAIHANFPGTVTPDGAFTSFINNLTVALEPSYMCYFDFDDKNADIEEAFCTENNIVAPEEEEEEDGKEDTLGEKEDEDEDEEEDEENE